MAEGSDQKNPVEFLNDLKPGIIFDLSSSGPDCAKVFTASVEFKGKRYSAVGTSKQKAKNNVATIVVESLPANSTNSAHLMKIPQNKVCFPTSHIRYLTSVSVWCNVGMLWNWNL